MGRSAMVTVLRLREGGNHTANNSRSPLQTDLLLSSAECSCIDLLRSAQRVCFMRRCSGSIRPAGVADVQFNRLAERFGLRTSHTRLTSPVWRSLFVQI